MNKNHNGKATGTFEVPMMRVDIECIHCGVREVTSITRYSNLNWIKCPYCDERSKLEFAVIEYLD